MQAELSRRVELLDRTSKDIELKKIEMARCHTDILYFFDNYLYTDKNKTIFADDWISVIPFIPFDFQRELITEVWESITEGNKPVQDRKPWVLTNVFIEKSRQMWVSWVIAAIFVYWFIFHKHKYSIISRTADEVDKSWDMDSMFEKLRFMLRKLPDWMLPAGFQKEQGRDKSNSYMNISDPNSSASITGKTANPDAGRWGTRNAIFMDEMASMQYAHEINKAAGSNTPCRIFNSTPNGEGNEFYRMRKLTMVHKNSYWEIEQPQVKWLRYHRTDHPLYDQAWYDWKVQGMTPEEIAQELEIDYNVSIEGRVYPEFAKESVNIEYDPDKSLYVAIDNSHWWADPNAIILVQPDNQYWNIIDAIEVSNTPEHCADFLSWQPRFQLNNMQERFLERYKSYNRQRAIFIADPYDTKVAMWNSTILDDYKKVGINLFTPSNRDKTHHISKTRTNIYRIRYNDNCLDFASAISNARYPERKENSNATTEISSPVHNRTSHFRTALEYFVVYMLENNNWLDRKKPRIAQDLRPYKDPRTRKMIYPEAVKN